MAATDITNGKFNDWFPGEG